MCVSGECTLEREQRVLEWKKGMGGGGGQADKTHCNRNKI